MHKLDLSGSHKFDSYGVIDIETDGFDGSVNSLVAIGAGFHDGSGSPEVAVSTYVSSGYDEASIIRHAYEWLNTFSPDGLITYNGTEFDFDFLSKKIDELDIQPQPSLPSNHLDLFSERKRLASQANKKWPRLEECLSAYNIPVDETEWNGNQLTGKLLAEKLAPKYFRAIKKDDRSKLQELETTIRRYTASDIDATIALYEADLGRKYNPSYPYPQIP